MTFLRPIPRFYQLTIDFKVIIALFALNLGAAMLAFPEFFAPISADTSIYAYYGRQIASGQILYRDLWDFKSPGIYYLFALLFKLFPDSLTTLRFAALATNFVSSLLLYRIGRRYAGQTAALLGTGIFLTTTNLGGYLNQDGPYPETFMPLLALTAFYFWDRYWDGRSLLNVALAGLFGAGLVVMKQISLSFIAGMGLYLLLKTRGRGFSKILGTLAAFAGGVALGILPWLLYFRWVGAWPDFLNAVVLYPRSYPSTTAPREAILGSIRLVRTSLAPLGVVWILATVGGWIVLRPSSEPSTAGRNPKELLVWLGVGLIFLSLPMRFYERYLVELLVPAILLTIIAIEGLLAGQTSQVSPQPQRMLLFALGGLFLLGTVTQQLPRALHWTDDRVLNWTPTRSERLAEYLGEPQQSGEAIFAWGDPRIPYVTHRLSGVRWLNNHPFYTSPEFVTKGRLRKMLHELSSNPPRYFVESPARPPLSESYLGGTVVDRFIRQHYQLIARIGDADLYEYLSEP